MVKYRSETKRGGVPESHDMAACKIYWAIINYFQDSKFQLLIQVDKWTENFDATFIKYHHLSNPKFSSRQFKGHEYDLIIRIGNKITHFIEIGDVGDDTRHNPGHKSQLINDGIAKSWVEYKYPHATYIKINKDDAEYSKFLVTRLKLKRLLGIME